MTEFIDKPNYVLTGMYVPGANGEIASREEMAKIDKILQYVLQCIDKFVEEYDHQMQHSHLQYRSVQLQKEEKWVHYSKCFDHKALFSVEADGAKFVIQVENFNDFQLRAHAVRNRAQIRIPISELAILPDEMVVANMSEYARDKYEWFLNHFFHEFFHMLGAYHADTGIMSGVITLFNNNNNTLRLVDLLDDISARILSESLSNKITAIPPEVVCTMKDNKLDLWTNYSIHTIVVLSQTNYTNQFFFACGFEFSFTIPQHLQWDAVVVQLVYGGAAYFDRNSLRAEPTKPDRIRCRLPMVKI
ncbi:hypothetical protein L5515_016784 [Caenorhabditis briggsae]|uniref:Uncharacterized protein n=1 Tax=Caenorhabditis briggsae TaxID=6238 RepID=A0AAE9FF07_CAEBR|nr:hypothetical protein L5515_016784 [Caenorhabditis briggsae]